MNLQDVINLESTYLGNPETLREIASSLSDGFYELYDSTASKLEVIQIMFSHLIDQSPFSEDEVLTVEQYFNDAGSEDRCICITLPNGKAISIDNSDYNPQGYCEINIGESYGIYYNHVDGHVVFLMDTLGPLRKYTDGTDCNVDPTILLQEFASGSIMSKIFGDICALVKNGDPEGNDQNIINSINGIISNAQLEYDVKSELLSAAMLGPKAVVEYVAGIVAKTEDTLEHPDSDENLYNTSVVVKSFSFGAVLGFFVTVAQVTGAVLTALSKIGQIVAGIIGVATQLFTNIASSIVGIAAGATFSCVHWNGTPAFNLVLNEVTVDNALMAHIIRNIGAKSFTWWSQIYPAILVGYLKYPDNPDDSTIVIQEIPSINFSFKYGLKLNSSYYSFENSQGVRFFTIHNQPASYDSHITLPTLTFHKSYIGPDDLGAMTGFAFKPISLDLGYVCDSLKDLANNDIMEIQANIWAERLYTSLILWLLYKNSTLLYNATHVQGSVDWTSRTGVFFPAQMEVDYDHLHSLSQTLLQSLKVLCYRYASVYLNDDGSLKSDISFKNVQDALVTIIQGNFNQLKWRDENEYIYSNADLGSTVDSNLISGSADYLSVTDLAYWLAPESYKSFLLDELPFSALTVSSTYHVSDGYARYCAVNIPTATISSIYIGVLADIAVLAVATVVTVAAIKVSIKIKNARSKKQAEVEAKWYKYQDALSEQVEYEDPETGEIKTRPHTKAELDKVWKEYKNSRLQYNIGAFFTGGTVLGLGLYDDGDTAGETITPMLNTLCLGTGADENQQVGSVIDIIKLIK